MFSIAMDELVFLLQFTIDRNYYIIIFLFEIWNTLSPLVAIYLVSFH